MNLIFEELISKDENDNTNKDLYKRIESRVKQLLDYFNLKETKFSIQIMLWDNLEEFRQFAKEKLKADIPDWMCGWVQKNENKRIIHTLTLNKLKECATHENNKMEDLENLIIHEFVHILVKDIASNQKVKKWLNEALATALSNQKHTYRFNQSIESFKNDNFVDYGVFQLIGDCLIKEEKKEYIIKLLKDSSYLDKEVTNVYKKVKEYYEKSLKSN